MSKEQLPTKGTYCGIADCHGLESLILVEDAEIDFLFMRACSNPQRHATVYKVELTAEQVALIGSHLKKGNFVGALRCLKTMERGENEECGKLTYLAVENPKFWNKIPNPKLDPYYTTEREEKMEEIRESSESKKMLNGGLN